jgi:hypothetical protein
MIQPQPFDNALEIIGQEMRNGVSTHPDDGWVMRSIGYHIGRAQERLRLLHDGDQQQDHLSHAATRLLMAPMPEIISQGFYFITMVLVMIAILSEVS